MSNFPYIFQFLSGWSRTGLKQFRSSPQQESNREVAALQPRHDGSSWKWCKSSPSPADPIASFSLLFRSHFYFILRALRLKAEPACTSPGKPSWGTTRAWARRRCPRRRGRSFTGRRPTRRVPTAATAAGRRATRDTTPAKTATRRWATPPAAAAPGRSPSGWTKPSSKSASEWKTKTRRAPPSSVTPPPTPPSPAAPWRATLRPRVRPKQSTPDGSQPEGFYFPATQTEPRLPCFLERPGGGKKQLLQWWKCASASDLPQDFVWMFIMTFYFNFCLNNSACLCLELSVLNQNSPIMNVKQAEAEKRRNVSKYCDTFSFYLISFHWSKGGVWEPLWLFIIYLHPQLLYIYYYLLFSHKLWCSIFSNSGDKVIIICHVCWGLFFSTRGLLLFRFFFNSLEFSFVFTVVKELSLYNIWVTYVAKKYKCIRFRQTIWALLWNIVWRLQCTELKALTMALVSEGLCIVYKMRSKDVRELYPKSVWWQKILYGNQKYNEGMFAKI